MLNSNKNTERPTRHTITEGTSGDNAERAERPCKRGRGHSPTGVQAAPDTRASRERVCPRPFSGPICPSRFQNAARCDGRCSAVRFLFRSAAFSSTMCTGSRVRTRQSVFFEDVWGAPHQYNAHGLSGSTPAIPRNDNPPSRFPPYNAYGLPFARLCRWRGIRACFVPGRTPNALSSKTPCVLKNAILPKTPCPQKALPPKTPCLQKALPPKTPCLQNTMPPKTPCHQKHHAFKTPCPQKRCAPKDTMPSKGSPHLTNCKRERRDKRGYIMVIMFTFHVTR